MTAPRSSTATLIAALEVLANDIQSEDGIANAAMLEAAQRLGELQTIVTAAWLLVESEYLALHACDGPNDYFPRDLDPLYRQMKREVDAC